MISGFEGGGVETLLLRLIEKMPPETEFHVIAHRIDYAPCAEAFRQLGVTIHLIPCRKHYFAHQRALCRLFLQYRPDVVHVHTTEWGYLSLRAAKNAGCLSGFSIHTPPMPVPLLRWRFSDPGRFGWGAGMQRILLPAVRRRHAVLSEKKSDKGARPASL